MGIEPFLIASTVNTNIGQRLVRRIAPDREMYLSNEVETKAILDHIGHLLPKTQADAQKVCEDLGAEDLPLGGQKAYTLTKGKDSPRTPGGYSGRVGLYEVVDVTEEIQNLIIARATSNQIEKVAIEQGLVTMAQDGYLKVLQGLTSIEEVNRVAAGGD
jgi:type IV pilus assembly protein PilB